MEVLLQNPERENLSVTFELSPFITGWPSAEERFITAINREFSELLPVRPQDFSSSRAGELGESYCKYRIFGGRSTIVLNPDTLQLNFVEFIEIDNEIVIEIIRRSLDMLSKDIGGYTRNHFYGNLYKLTISGLTGFFSVYWYIGKVCRVFNHHNTRVIGPFYCPQVSV